MAKHHHHHQHHPQNTNRSPRLRYMTSHSQSFMSECGEMTEMMSLDESDNLLDERYGVSGPSIQVISGSAYNGGSAGPSSHQQNQQQQQQQRMEELGIGFSDGGYNSKLLSPAVTIVEMTAGGLLPNAGNMRKKNFKNKSAAAAAMAATGEQASLNAIGLQLSVDRGGPQEWGEATRSYVKAQRRHAGRATFQGQVYNFLERPAGYKCFVYHVAVWGKCVGVRGGIDFSIILKVCNLIAAGWWKEACQLLRARLLDGRSSGV
ncbi:AAEL009455-PA [Aedes aegypti]|uniref:AAEL009455-PA n=1 Tax=Aedes aegypti TaxID=7159 RepID=Q16VS3_AEDAE|nr:AAEL009455-PA [Aedes aegypti]